MWYALFLTLFAFGASGEHFQAWKTDSEYVYLVRGRTLAALQDVDDQYTGITSRAKLTIQPKNEDTLQAKLSKACYARIHTKLPDGWKTEIPDDMAECKQLPLSEKVFEIKMKHGTIRDVIVDRDVPTWEVNMLKSIVGQLQVDTQGENLMPSKDNHVPEEDDVNAMYKTMEDSVGGRCEVMYTISSLPEYSIRERHEWSENLALMDGEQAIDIMKTKNYTNCEERMSDNFGISGSSGREVFPKEDSQFMSRSSISRIIITGDLKTFTIRSSVTTDQIILSPSFYENDKGMVSSRVNVTLVKMGPVSPGSWSTPANPESTGNLVYNYNNPFAVPGEARRPGVSHETNDAAESAERVRYPTERSWEDDSLMSPLDVDSLESNEQLKSRMQPKPMLNEAPSMPLLPFFIGNGGKMVNSAIDPSATVKTLARQIGNELHNPNTMTDEGTLEKFSILVRLLRTMNTQQMADALSELFVSGNVMDSQDESQSVRLSTWIAFRDAVAHVGTGPALVTIKNLIKEGKLMGIEAAMIVGVLPETARTPTPEYLDTFFEMITMPETMEQEFLNSTAMVAFGHLIRYSQVNAMSAHNRYPVHSFGRLSPKNNPAVFRVYIPHMAEQLKKAIENKDLAKSHVFIKALGAVAHRQILAVFEPYLEGKIAATTFQRLLMVMSMNKLASLEPALIRGVLYKIYQNTAEAHQLRCAAVTLIVSTNPPASMLQRMAEFTNHDVSKQVDAAVKTAIESASELTGPESEDLATKARNVLPLLNKDNYGFEYSENWLFDYVRDTENFALRGHLAEIGGGDSFIPQALYGRMSTMYGDFKVPETEMGAMVSNIKDLHDVWKWQYGDDQGTEGKDGTSEYSVEKIAEMLKLQSGKTDQFESAFWINDIYENMFFSFDKNSFRRIPDLMMKTSTALNNGHNFNMARINTYEVTISFPMESGLPFLYTFEMPSVSKVSGSIRGSKDASMLDGSLEIRVLHASQRQARLGFVTPFDHQHYVAGLNDHSLMQLPLRVKMHYVKPEKQASLTFELINPNEDCKLMSFGLMPFTANHDVSNMSPLIKDKNTHRLIKNEVLEKTYITPPQSHGLRVKVVSELDAETDTSPYEDLWKHNPLIRFFTGWSEGKIDYRLTELYLLPNQSTYPKSITLSASVETLRDDSIKQAMMKSEKLKAEVPKVKSKLLNDPERRKQLLREMMEGIVGAEGIAVDLGIDLPGEEPFHCILTLAYAKSKVDEQSRGALFMRVDTVEKSGELCAGLTSRSPQVSPMDMMMAKKQPKLSTDFDMELRIGETCETGTKLRINGTQEQTEKYRQFIQNLVSSKKCEKDMVKGKKLGPVCQELRNQMLIMNEARMNIEFESNDQLMDVVSGAMELTGNAAVVTRNRDKGMNSNTMEMTMSFDPLENVATFAYSTPDTKAEFAKVDVGPLGNFIGNANPDLSMTERLNLKLNDIHTIPNMCILDMNSATTFDKAAYPMHLGQCWHVAMITNPPMDGESPWSKKNTMNDKLSILVRDTMTKKKEAKMILGDMELELKVIGDEALVSMNGKEIDLKKSPVYTHKIAGVEEFEVFRRADDSIRVFSSKHGIDVIYTGQDLRIKATGNYRNGIRGLCGDYNGEPDNDFTSPKNCKVKMVDEFVASYALPTKDCQGPSRELAERVNTNMAECERLAIRPGNVVNDRAAGRKARGKSSWGFHAKEINPSKDKNRMNNRCMIARTKIIEESDQMCFTLRPVPTCANGCTVIRSKPKVMPVYCVPNGPNAQAIADRINQGANPDFSQKEVSKKQAFDMPVFCEAA